ncbi:MAG: peptidylprolyl isomerase [Planctomycetota bacterium]
MLGFFHRHQKSFLLILLAPALIAMGISGVMMNVMTHQGQQVAGRIYGEDVNLVEFQRIKSMFQATSPNAGDEEAWRFYAYLRAAERNGVDVSDDEVGRNIQNSIRFTIAQSRALKELKEKKVDLASEEGRKQFQQIYFRYVLSDDIKFDPKEYEDAVRAGKGLGVREFEAQEVREGKVQRLFELLKDMGTVSPQEVWDAYQDEAHLSKLDLIELSAKDYTPKLAAKEGEKGFISKKDLEAYYEARKADYDEPRRVKLAFVGVVQKDAEGEVEAPGLEALRAFNAAEGIAPVGSFSEAEDKIRDAWFAARARERVEAIMDAVAQRVEKAKLEKEVPDLKAIAAAVKQELKTEVLLTSETGLVTEEELAKEDLLSGFAARRWFRTGDADPTKKSFATSDVLAGDKGWFLLQTREVKYARTPAYADVEAQVRKDYATGSERERKAYYEAHKADYLLDQAWVIEAALAADARFEKSHDKAKEALHKALSVAEKWGAKFPMKKFETDPDVPQLEVKEWERLTRAEFDKDEVLKGVASEVATAQRGALSRVFEYPGGWAVFRVVKQLERDTRPYEEVKEQVAEAVALDRAVERAELASGELLNSLRHLRGAELDQALAAKGLKPRRTEAFKRGDMSLEGIADASRLVSEAYSAEAKVGGGYQAVVPDHTGKRVFLVRVAERVDAPDDGFAARYQALRKDLLAKKRGDFAEQQQRRILLLAKGISDELVSYATAVRDGPNGETRVRFRQVFLPPDREILDGWLEGQAREKLGLAQKALAAGKSWASVVDEFSEHDATRRQQGELPDLSREELQGSFGTDFVEAVFSLPKGVVSQPVKSKLGMHLVRLVGTAPNGKKRFQHLMVKTDAETRKLPDSVRQQAEASSKAKLDKALGELQAGKSFAEVAEAYGDKLDAYGQGQELEVDYVTNLERAALGQYIGLELPETHPSVNDPAWVPDVVAIDGPKGPTYHFFACGRTQHTEVSGFEDSRWLDRDVYHIESSNKADVDAARESLQSKLKAMAAKEQERSWFEILKLFRELAEKRSQAPSAAKGGALGSMGLAGPIRHYGEEFLKNLCYTADGKPVTAGHRSAVFRGQSGYHLLEVLEVETAKPGDPKRQSRVAEQVLDGTDWK